jgi:serine protease Do
MDDFNFSNYNNDYDSNSSDSSRNNYDSVYNPTYYTESYKKPKNKRGGNVLQLLSIALLSSVLGGGIVFLVMQFVGPAIAPSANSFLSELFPSKTYTENTSVHNTNSDVYKKIEITQSDTPVTAIAEKVSPSIVGIRSTSTMQDFFFGVREVPGEGSGIIIRSDGYIMTNNHVIENALEVGSNNLSRGSKIEVVLPNQIDKPYPATVVGRDAKTDLAVIKIDLEGLPAAEMGNSDELRVGELAVAIGNPGGLEYMGSVTVGVISGLNRKLKTENGKEFNLIQTDASINPGNSGGALVNSRGQVIGVNTIKIAATGFEGLGFAIPINKAKEVTDSLIQHKYVKGRPFLGVSIDPRFNEQIAKQYNVPMGLLVADVVPLSGAYKAGIQRGDIITKFDGKEVKSFEELEEVKNKHKPGDVVEIEIYRGDGKTLTLKVEITEDKG